MSSRAWKMGRTQDSRWQLISVPLEQSPLSLGLSEVSYTTRSTSPTSLTMRLGARASMSCGNGAQCAVMKSRVCTARSRDGVLIGTRIAHNAGRTQRQEHGNGLRGFLVPTQPIGVAPRVSRNSLMEIASRLAQQFEELRDTPCLAQTFTSRSKAAPLSPLIGFEASGALSRQRPFLLFAKTRPLPPLFSRYRGQLLGALYGVDPGTRRAAAKNASRIG